MERKISLAILGSRGIPARYGGFETFAEELAVRLVERGIEVTVYCEKDDNIEQPTAYKGVRLVYLSSPKAGPLSTVIFDLKCLWHARKEYNAVYMLGYGTSLFCFIPRLWNQEVWINMDGIEYSRAKWNRLARIYLRMMEAFATITPSRLIADAEAIHHHLQKKYKRLPPCSVIPYGSYLPDQVPDKALLGEWNLETDDYYLIVCRLEPENHVLELLQGFAASGSKKKLIVVGNHRMKTPYVAQLSGVRDPRIRFIGTVYDQTKLQALRCHSFAYFHGHSVGGTNPSLLEAMGCGNFIVAHNNPFNREVTAGQAEYFLKPDDLIPIVSEIESEGFERTPVRQKMKELILEKYTWDGVTEQYLRLLKAVAIPSHARPQTPFKRRTLSERGW